MGRQAENADAIIRRIASRQLGLVTWRQLIASGVSEKAIRVRLARGSLVRCHPGVYAVGAPPTSAAARYLAAALGCGDGARVSGLAAAHLLSLIDGAPPAPEVTAPKRRRLDGVLVHHSRLIGSRHTTLVDGVPASRPAVALVEIADRVDDVRLSRAVHKAIVRLVSEESMRVALGDRPNYRGRGRVEAILFGDEPLLLSDLERRFRALLDDHALPLPETNQKLDGRYVDCRWPDHRLTIELLGFRFHNSRATWEVDHARRREARRRGDDFRTFTYDDVTRYRAQTVAEMTDLLRRQSHLTAP